jgi:hypothetical protein
MRLELVLLRLARNPAKLHLFRLIGEGHPFEVDGETGRVWVYVE